VARRPHRAHAAAAEEGGDLVGAAQHRADLDLARLCHCPADEYNREMRRTAYLPARAALAALVCIWVGAAAAAEEPVDVTEYKAKLRVLTDGKGHYVTLMPFTIGDGPDTGYLFYGDGKAFYAQRRFGGYRNGNEAFDTSFWEPRFKSANQASLGYKDKKWTVSCGDRTIDLTLVDKPEAERMLGEAKFYKPRWGRQAYALARDNSGTYYYVDRARDETAKDFRVFRGPKGAVKAVKMVNVVNDSDGDIFITKAGKLRLVLDKKETAWLDGKRQTKLSNLDVLENRSLIYSELGVYAGERLGTPCDDL
jgi:hypothetical protein